MNTASPSQSWEERLRAGLRQAPAPDFDDWCSRYAAALLPEETAVSSQSVAEADVVRIKKPILKSLKWIALVMLIGAGLIWYGLEKTLNQNAFAEAIPGVDDVQSMTWTTTWYEGSTFPNGTQKWLKPQRRFHFYRHPGQYRELDVDDAGKPTGGIRIYDGRVKQGLSLDPRAKIARPIRPEHAYKDVRGPFAWVRDTLRDRKSRGMPVTAISLQGRKNFEKHDTNVVRVMFAKEDEPNVRMDLMFDSTSKQLRGVWVPWANNKLDLEAVQNRKQPDEKRLETVVVVIATLDHEIVLNPKLDPADFSLTPPAGYTLETKPKPTVTEEEMLAYLKAAVHYNGNVFPDSPYQVFDRKKFNEASFKPEKERSAVEQEMIDAQDKIMLREIYRPPVMQFEEDHTVPKSLRYVGSGVKLGEKDRLVFWYKLRGATKFRAVYGDFSVKDVTAAELPLDL